MRPRRPVPFAALLAALGTALAATPAAGAGAGIEGYVYSSPVPHDRITAGRVALVVRSDAPLPVGATVRIGGRWASLGVVSAELRCYTANAWVNRDRRRDAGRAGARVRVTIGKGGRVLDRRFRVRPAAPELLRGAALGCDADPASTTAYFGLSLQPEVEPERVFFTANAGPYLRDVTWAGWGAAQAVGTGTYVSDCASCGPKQELPARLVLERPVACAGWGVQVYTRMRLEKTLPSGEIETRRLGSNDTACA